MLRYITHNGKELPVDYNVMTLAKIASHYGTDLTGIQEMLGKFKSEEQYLEFIATIGSISLTRGAARAGEKDKVYTHDDIYDMLTEDMAFAECLFNGIFASMEGGAEVFPKAAKATPKPPKKKRR